uniref:Eukaryotic elongation factor 2 lysine methyltransferase n=1 Tax=Sphaeramia orbicularis TaxID=375764 RepID=A0A672YKQ3_9TELE
EILKQTCFHPLCRKFPPSVKYRRLFISELIRRLEAADCDPLDELYDALAEVLGAEEDTECYKTYLLPCGAAVSLSESVALILGGTTGLVTWEAALHLTEWALDHQQTFRVKLKYLPYRCNEDSCFPLTCHPTVLQKLRDNVDLNGLDEQTVRVEELDWSTVTDEQLRAFGADTVIAAVWWSAGPGSMKENAGISHHVITDPVRHGKMIKLYIK